MISGIGSTAMRVELVQAPSPQGPVGSGKAVITMATNRWDSFQVSFDDLWRDRGIQWRIRDRNTECESGRQRNQGCDRR